MPLIVVLTGTALAEPSWHRLYSASAQASSFLQSNWNKYTENYHPSYAFDDNPATAWVEGESGDGIGDVLSWDVSALSSARAVKLRIRDGYQKSDALLAANSAPTDVKIRVYRGRELVAQQAATLKPAMGLQDVVVDTGGKGFDHLELEIVGVRAGSKYKDTCLSDVQTWVDSDVPYNAAFEDGKLATLKKWAADRLETAKFYAALPPTYPFAGLTFHDGAPANATCPSGTGKAAVDALAATRSALGASPFYSAAPAASATRIAPDGLYELPVELLPLLRTANVSFFEAKGAQGKHDDGRDSEEVWLSNYRLVKATGGAVQAVSFDRHTVEHGRGSADSRATWTLTYDDHGHLAGAVGADHQSDDDGWSRDVTHVWQLRWNAAGQIDQLTQSDDYGDGCTQQVWVLP